MSEYTTIVIKHEKGARPITGFNQDVLGCEVTAIAVGHRLDNLDVAETIIEQVGEMLDDLSYEKEDILEYINSFSKD